MQDDYARDFVSKCLGGLETCDLRPFRLVNTNAIENGREFMTILGSVDLLGVSTKDVDATSLLEAESNVLGKLT